VSDKLPRSSNPYPSQYTDPRLINRAKYEGWNFNSGNYLFTTDTK